MVDGVGDLHHVIVIAIVIVTAASRVLKKRYDGFGLIIVVRVHQLALLLGTELVASRARASSSMSLPSYSDQMTMVVR